MLNSTLGWWWADAGAALIIAGIAVREGISAWKGDLCCTVAHTAADNDADADDCCSASATGAGATAKERASSAAMAAPVKERAPAPAAAAEGTCCEGCGSAGGPQAVRSGPSRRNDEASEHSA